MNLVYHDTRAETSQEWMRIPAELRGHHGVLIAQCGLRQNGGVLRDVDKWRSIDWQRFAGFGLRTLKRLEAAGLVTRPSPSELQVTGYLVDREELYEQRCEINRKNIRIRWAETSERLQRKLQELTSGAPNAPKNTRNGASTTEKPQGKDGQSTGKVRSKTTTESPDSRAFGDTGGTSSGIPGVLPLEYQGKGAERSSAQEDLPSPSPHPSSQPSAPEPVQQVPGRGGSPDGDDRSRIQISEVGEARLERFAATYPKWRQHWRPKVLEQFVAAGLDDVSDDDYEKFIGYIERKARSDHWRQQDRRWVPTPWKFLASGEWIRRRAPPRPPASTTPTETAVVPVYTAEQLAEIARESKNVVRAARATGGIDPGAKIGNA